MTRLARLRAREKAILRELWVIRLLEKFCRVEVMIRVMKMGRGR